MARCLSIAGVDSRGWCLVTSFSDSDAMQFRRLRKNGFYAGCATLEELLEKCNQTGQADSCSESAPALNLDIVSSPIESASPVVRDVIEKFYFLNHEGSLASFAELRLDSFGPETSHRSKTLVLRGRSGGIRQLQVEVNAWKVEFGEIPTLFVQDLQGSWMQLGNPLPVYEAGKSMVMLLKFVSFVKQNPNASLKAVLDHLLEVCSQRPTADVLLQHEDVLRKLAGQYAAARELLAGKRKKDDELAGQYSAAQELAGQHSAADEQLSRKRRNKCCDSDKASNKRLRTSYMNEGPTALKEQPKAFNEKEDKAPNIFEDEEEWPKVAASDEQETEDDEAGESVCAICDDGGNLLCCDGPCLRSFHGLETDLCIGLEKYMQRYSQDFNYAYTQQSRKFFCPNCVQNQHQCNSCGKLGSSQEGPSQEVFLCDVALCGKFYHHRCVSLLLGNKDVSTGFRCPLHSCHRCQRGEEDSWLFECRRCPRAWHRGCTDERIKFEEEDGVIARGWVIGETKFLYCMRHSLVSKLRTPIRDHLAFPRLPLKDKLLRSKSMPSTTGMDSLAVFSKADVDEPIQSVIRESEKLVTHESVAQMMKCPSTVASAPNKNCQRNRIESLLNAFWKACDCIRNGGRIEEAQLLFPLKDLKLLEATKDSLRVYLSPMLYGMRYTSYGRHFTVKSKLETLVERLCWYVNDGDTLADLCCGANTFSRLMERRLRMMGKQCRFKNYDFMQPSDTFCFERRDYTTIRRDELGPGNNLIIGLNPPFGVKAQTASSFAVMAASFQPKIIILIAPRETKRLEDYGYELIWEDCELLKGDAFYLPGSLAVDGKTIRHDNQDVPVLFLWSSANWKDLHKRIAQEQGHCFR